MLNLDINNPLWNLVARFAIDTVAIVMLIFFMYYRRYRDRELATYGNDIHCSTPYIFEFPGDRCLPEQLASPQNNMTFPGNGYRYFICQTMSIKS